MARVLNRASKPETACSSRPSRVSRVLMVPCWGASAGGWNAGTPAVDAPEKRNELVLPEGVR